MVAPAPGGVDRPGRVDLLGDGEGRPDTVGLGVVVGVGLGVGVGVGVGVGLGVGVGGGVGVGVGVGVAVTVGTGAWSRRVARRLAGGGNRSAGRSSSVSRIAWVQVRVG